MPRSRNAAPAVIALACLSSAVSAQREPVQAQVPYADFDLASSAGRATFAARLRTAACRRCGVAVTVTSGAARPR